MTHEKTLGPIADYHESVATSFEAQEGHAHLATSVSIHTNLGQSRQLTATLGMIPDLSSHSAEGKPERSTQFREHKSLSPGFSLSNPREIAAFTVRVAVLVGIIWFALM